MADLNCISSTQVGVSETTECVSSQASMTLLPNGTGLPEGEVDIKEGQIDVETESPETQVLKVVHSHLVEVFSLHVDTLATQLHKEGLVGLRDYSSVVQELPSKKRAMKLLLAVISTVRAVPINFEKFMRVLENYPSFNGIVTTMKQHYKGLLSNCGCPIMTAHIPRINQDWKKGSTVDDRGVNMSGVRRTYEEEATKRDETKERELQLTRQELIHLKQRLEESEKQLEVATFQSKFFQEQVQRAQSQIAKLTSEVVELKQQLPSCGAHCEHYVKNQLLERENEKLDKLRQDHVARIACLNSQLTYLLDSS